MLLLYYNTSEIFLMISTAIFMFLILRAVKFTYDQKLLDDKEKLSTDLRGERRRRSNFENTMPQSPDPEITQDT